MEDQNVKVLDEVSKGTTMGMDAISYVASKVGDRKFQEVLDIEYDNLETFNNVATATSEEVLAVISKDTLDKLFEFIRTGKSIRIKGSDNNEPSTYYTMFPISQSRSENSYSITLMIGTIIYTYTFTSDYALTITKIQLATSTN